MNLSLSHRQEAGYKAFMTDNRPEPAILFAELIESRRTVLPKRLQEPGPDAAELDLILQAAASAPDHERLLPWRFVIVPAGQRHRLAEVFAQSLAQRDANASAQQLEQAREKAYRAPLLMLAVAQTEAGETGVDSLERVVSAGCAIQNVLLMATALGFGSALTSGKALRSEPLHTLFNLQPGEQPLCFISVGTVQAARPAQAARPLVDDYVSTLGQGGRP